MLVRDRQKDVVAAAREAGFARTTLYVARLALGPRVLETGAGLHDPRRLWRTGK